MTGWNVFFRSVSVSFPFRSGPVFRSILSGLFRPGFRLVPFHFTRRSFRSDPWGGWGCVWFQGIGMQEGGANSQSRGIRGPFPYMYYTLYVTTSRQREPKVGWWRICTDCFSPLLSAHQGKELGAQQYDTTGTIDHPTETKQQEGRWHSCFCFHVTRSRLYAMHAASCVLYCSVTSQKVPSVVVARGRNWAVGSGWVSDRVG